MYKKVIGFMFYSCWNVVLTSREFNVTVISESNKGGQPIEIEQNKT